MQCKDRHMYHFTLLSLLTYLYIHLKLFSHGTSCAGIIAGRKGTDCGVGIAYNAQISGKIRALFDSEVELRSICNYSAVKYVFCFINVKFPKPCQ